MLSRSPLHVTVQAVEDACVIRAVGEIDISTIGRLRAPLEAARADGRTALLDMSAVRFIDSHGLRLMLEAAQTTERSDWAWFLVRPSAVVRRLVEITDSAPLLPIVTTERLPAPRAGSPRRRRAARSRS